MNLKVGLLFSETGVTSLTELGQLKAAKYAIERNHYQLIDVYEVDTESSPEKAAQKAEILAKEEGVRIFIGCYTSACRKALIPVLESYDAILIYPTLYEGMEDHPNIFYTGELPNQQVNTLIDYSLERYGKSYYFIGNDYIYPKESNKQAKAYIESKGGRVINEAYVPFGHKEFSQIAQDIILKKPDVIFSNLVGQSVISFYEAMYLFNHAEKIPIFSPITKETELKAMDPAYGEGHYSSASYFQSIDSTLNHLFIQDFKQRFGQEEVVSSVMFNTYLGTTLLLDKLKTNDFKLKELSFDSISVTTACGEIKSSANQRHLSRPVRIGKARRNGQFDIVWDSEVAIQPLPNNKPFKERKQVAHEIILDAWGKITSEIMLALQGEQILYLSKKAEQVTGLKARDLFSQEKEAELKKLYHIYSYPSDEKKLCLFKPKQQIEKHQLSRFGQIKTRNKAFKEELNTAKIASQSDANVLILGETGTGKEVIAQEIHRNSRRASGPFIAVNTGALPPDLIMSELFGYAEGSFTGAQTGGKIGKFESANGGTLFLDEIGEMPLEQQVYLLRALERKAITRIGEHIERPLDVRVITATNRNLEEEIVYNNSFRSDLFYRINVLTINLPSLRERSEDIPLLALELLDRIHSDYQVIKKTLSNEAVQTLIEYPWPGNIRELKNSLERAYLLSAEEEVIRRSHLSHQITHLFTRKSPKRAAQSLKEIERQAIKEAISETDTLEIAAKQLGIARSTLYRKLKEYDIVI